MVSIPGCFTASEALLALKFGADALKLFPASSLGPNTFNAINQILPKIQNVLLLVELILII